MSTRPWLTDVLPPFRRSDLPTLGLSPRRLLRLQREGHVVQVLRGAYLDARCAEDPATRAAAAALVLPAGAVVARRSAAWLHGVDARAPSELGRPLPVECVVPAGGTVPHREGLDAREARLLDEDTTTTHGVPVTTPDRTALDLARCSSPHMGLAVVDAMAHAGLVDPAALLVRVEDWRGERWIARARRVMGLCEPATESFGESWLRLRFVDAGFPCPRPQVSIPGGGALEVYRLDMGWEEARVAGEYDGVEFHSSPEQRLRDIHRREALAVRYGWTAVGVGRAEVLGTSTALERAFGQLLGIDPRTRRRAW